MFPEVFVRGATLLVYSVLGPCPCVPPQAVGFNLMVRDSLPCKGLGTIKYVRKHIYTETNISGNVGPSRNS